MPVALLAIYLHSPYCAIACRLVLIWLHAGQHQQVMISASAQAISQSARLTSATGQSMDGAF